METKELKKLCENVEGALRRIIQKGENISASELDNAEKAICLMRGIKALKREEENENAYSEGSYRRGRARGSYGDDPYYNPYTNGGGMSRHMSRTNRGADGRFYNDASDGYYRDSGQGSNDGGRSGHSIKDRMIDQLERMANGAHGDYERETVEKYIRMLESVD